MTAGQHSLPDISYHGREGSGGQALGQLVQGDGGDWADRGWTVILWPLLLGLLLVAMRGVGLVSPEVVHVGKRAGRSWQQVGLVS